MVVYQLPPASIYVAALAFILTIAALPYPFLAVLFVVSVIGLGENFDASPRRSAQNPPTFGMFFSYPWVKMVKFQHRGLFFSMMFKSTRLVTSILVVDISGKSHCLIFAPHATISN